MNLFGIITTLIYIGIVLFFRWNSLPTLKTIPLNEFGDFFAGVFGPLMLFWLILGYVQQQKELKQNTEMLKLQADELKKSVEQHKELVQTTKLQLETDKQYLEIEKQKNQREVKPDLVLHKAGWRNSGGGKTLYEFHFINSGKPISNLSFQAIPNEFDFKEGFVHYLGEGKEYILRSTREGTQYTSPKKLILHADGEDSNRNAHKYSFALTLNSDCHYSIE